MTCKDGTKSKAGKGACSGHGGVDKSASKSTSESKSESKKSKSEKAEKSESKSKSKSEKAETEKAEKSQSTAKKPAEAEEHAEVRCKDGTFSKGGKGACSGHGGVDKGETAAAPEVTPAATAAPTRTTQTTAASGEKGKPTAKCKDGTLSYSQHHTGTCSNHGGVAEWLDGTEK